MIVSVIVNDCVDVGPPRAARDGRRPHMGSRTGPSPGRPRRVIRGMRTPADLARPPTGFGEEGGTGGGEDLRAGAPMG